MEIVGRIEEIKILREHFQNNESSFLAIYGRRRVGKTYLIRQVYNKNIVFDCAGLQKGNKQEQLENFWTTLYEGKKKYPPLPTTWLQAFAQLKDYISKLKSTQKKVIFLDEISWYDSSKSGFLPALDNFWNQFCSKRKDIILIVCGSVASWIIKKIVYDKGGLHNRITQSILLKPFTLAETKTYLEAKKVKLSIKDIAQLYMCIGGIPYYLNHVKQSKSIPQILDNLFFEEQASLQNEFDKLYPALFANYELHIAIIKALATKHSGMRREEIIAKSGLVSGGGITDALSELMQCGFIEYMYPIQNKKVDTIYRLMDEFTLFYFNFLAKKSSKLSGMQLGNSQKFKIWSGYAFENLCIRHQDKIAKHLGIHGILYDVYSWIGKADKYNEGIQIDMVFDRSDNCINLFEIKFNAKQFVITQSYAKQLIAKREIFIEKTKSNKNVFITFISASGTVKNEHYLGSISNELTLENLFT